MLPLGEKSGEKRKRVFIKRQLYAKHFTNITDLEQILEMGLIHVTGRMGP